MQRSLVTCSVVEALHVSDRVYASMMGALAVDLLVAGKRSRVVGYRHGEFVDFDINEALAMQKNVDSYMWEVCNSLSHNYRK